MSAVFAFFLSKLIRVGNIEIETADGVKRRYGDGTGPSIAVKLRDRAAEWRLMRDPTLTLGELYMDGRFEVVRGDIYDVIALGARNLMAGQLPAWVSRLEKLRVWLRAFQRRNNRTRARNNVARHYDYDRRLYDLFLDADRQYSCAYFEHPGQSLDEAQLAKKRHLAAKMVIDDGQSALDIGCGFGGLGLYLAHTVGAKVTGVTLSEEQFAIATQRARDSASPITPISGCRTTATCRASSIGWCQWACSSTSARRVLTSFSAIAIG